MRTHGPEDVWDHLPREVQQQLLDRKLRFYVIDAERVAAETELGSRVNTVMQTCFFAISGVLPQQEAIACIKKSIEKTYGKKGPEVVANFAAVDHTLAHLYEVKFSDRVVSCPSRPALVPDNALISSSA